MKKPLCALLLFSLLALSFCAALADVLPREFAVANTKAVNVRKKPGGDLLQRLDLGENVYVLETLQKNGKSYAHVVLVDEQWTHQGWNRSGWVESRFLTGVSEAFQNVQKVAVGEQHIAALTTDGRLLSFGSTLHKATSLNCLTGVRDIEVSRFLTVAAMQDDTVRQSSDNFDIGRSGCPIDWHHITRLFADGIANGQMTGMDETGVLHTSCFWSSEVPLAFPAEWRHVSDFLFTWEYAAALLENGTLKTMSCNLPRELYDYATCPKAILDADGLTGVAEITGGTNWMLLLMRDGSLRLLRDADKAIPFSDIAEAARWTDIAHIYGGNTYALGITNDGRVRMAGKMVSANMNAAHESTDQWRNLEDDGTLSGYTDIISAACSPQIIALLHADGSVSMIGSMRCE